MKNPDNMQKIKNMLEQNEQIVWEGKPHLLFFILNASHISTIVGIVISIVGFAVLFQQNIGGIFVILIGLCTTLAMPIYRFIVWQSVFYLMTQDKIFTIEGLVGATPVIITTASLTKQSVENSFIETISGGMVGTIVLTQAPPANQIVFGPLATLKLKQIAHPHDVMRFIHIPEQNAHIQPLQMPGFPPTALPTAETKQTVTTTYQSSSTTTDYSS